MTVDLLLKNFNKIIINLEHMTLADLWPTFEIGQNFLITTEGLSCLVCVCVCVPYDKTFPMVP